MCVGKWDAVKKKARKEGEGVEERGGNRPGQSAAS